MGPITLIFAPGEAPAPAHAIQSAPDQRSRWVGSAGTIFSKISFVVDLVAVGHSLLAMSGFETLAQVYREIAYPK